MLSFAPAVLPSLVLLIPGLVVAFAVCHAATGERLLGKAPIAAGTSLGIQTLVAALLSTVLLLGCMLALTLVSLVRNGPGPIDYPVLFTQKGELIYLSSLECAVWTVLLLCLSNSFLADVAVCVSRLGGNAFLGVGVSAGLALLPMTANYYTAALPIEGLQSLVPCSYFVPSRVVGYTGIFPNYDYVSACSFDPRPGTILLTVMAILIFLLSLLALDFKKPRKCAAHLGTR